jgi:transposase-like protein
MARRKQPTIPDALLDQLLAGADPKSAFDPNGLLDSLKKALTERALNAEMDHDLSGDEEAGNGRNRSAVLILPSMRITAVSGERLRRPRRAGDRSRIGRRDKR